MYYNSSVIWLQKHWIINLFSNSYWCLPDYKTQKQRGFNWMLAVFQKRKFIISKRLDAVITGSIKV